MDEPWCGDPRFATNADRMVNRSELDEHVAAWTSRQDAGELTQRLQSAGVAAGPVQTTPDLIADPQNDSRGFFAELGNDTTPVKPFPGLPVVIDGARGDGWRAAPKLGEHNREVLSDLLGMTTAEIEALEREGVLHGRPPE